jgi:hypothetical protein
VRNVDISDPSVDPEKLYISFREWVRGPMSNFPLSWRGVVGLVCGWLCCGDVHGVELLLRCWWGLGYLVVLGDEVWFK